MKQLKPITVRGVQGVWGSHLPFVWGAAGSAISLINLWRFPHIVGDHGGGAFVLLYLLCVFVLAIPIMLAEIVIGRRARMNPVYAIREIAREAGVSPIWGRLGWLVILASVMILPIYSVIGGWALEYIQLNGQGRFHSISAITSNSIFSSFMQDPGAMLKWHSAMILATVVLVASGVKGLAWVLKIMVPAMFVLMSVLMIKVLALGSNSMAVQWLFELRWQQMGWDSLLLALGHGFLTLGVGLGAVMAYAAYLPANTPMGRLALKVGGLDLIIAVMASMVILPLVFYGGMQPLSGPKLLFVSLPVVFGNMANGSDLALLFYLAVALVAISSTVPLLEPLVAYFVESKRWSRLKATIIAGATVWLLGLAVLFSFNRWQQLKPWLGMTVFELLDYITANFMMPLTGLLVAVLVAWLMPQDSARLGFAQQSQYRFKAWMMLLKYLAPMLVLIIFIVPAIQRLMA